MQPLRLCLFLAFITVLRCYELSRTQAEFYCVFNGNFSDMEQVKKDGAQRTLIDVSIQPVLAPALSPIPIVYLEHSNNGVLDRVYILIVTEGEDGVVFTTQYNISGNTQTKPGTFDVNQIKSFTTDNLQGQQACKAAYQRFEPLALSVNWQDCKAAKVNGERELYSLTFTCNNATAVVHAGAAENPTLVPYLFKRNGNKFPLESAPSNYVCNCDNTSG